MYSCHSPLLLHRRKQKIRWRTRKSVLFEWLLGTGQDMKVLSRWICFSSVLCDGMHLKTFILKCKWCFYNPEESKHTVKRTCRYIEKKAHFSIQHLSLLTGLHSGPEQSPYCPQIHVRHTRMDSDTQEAWKHTHKHIFDWGSITSRGLQMTHQHLSAAHVTYRKHVHTCTCLTNITTKFSVCLN